MSGQQCGKCGREHPLLRRGLCAACYGKNRERQTAYGRWNPDRVSTVLVRAHILALRNAGVSLRRIPGMAGVHRSTIGNILYGRPGREPAKYVSRATADAILAVPLPTDPLTVAADNDRVPALGAQRRLRALVAAGWPMVDLAGRLGMNRENFGQLIHHRTHIAARRHRDVVALFDELQLVPGPSERSREYALRKKWALPLQWDEDSIDDPAAKRAPRRDRRKGARVTNGAA